MRFSTSEISNVEFKLSIKKNLRGKLVNLRGRCGKLMVQSEQVKEYANPIGCLQPTGAGQTP